MRIVHVEKMLFAPSGVTSYVARLAQLQRQRGHDVHLFSCRPDAPADGDTFPPFVDFKARRRWTDLWPMIHNAEAAKLLRRFLDARPVDVAHVHNVYHHLTPSVLAELHRRRVPVVMTLHDYRLACPMRHFHRPDGPCTRCWPSALYHAASPRCAGATGAALAIETAVQRWLGRYRRHVNLFLCPTRFMQRIVRGIGVPASRTAVVRNVIEDMGEVLVCQPDCDGVLFAGRLSPEKGPELMLELARRIGWLQVRIAGDGPCREALEQQIRRDNLTNVRLLGQLDAPSLRQWMQNSAAVVVPSLAMENSPQVMLEAMQAGRCVVVPDQPPLREWVRDGVTGRLFDWGSADSLVRVVGGLMADPTGRAAMCRRARGLVRRRHDGERLASQIETLYQRAGELCGSR